VEFTWKKILAIVGCLLLLIVLPILLMSNGAMGWYQRRIDANPGSGFNRWLQLASADVCFRTMRPEMAVDRYRSFMRLYPRDEERPHALFRLARALEESNRNADAIKTYEQFIAEYPHREAEKRDCEMSIDRIKYVKPK
jgi:tetratricopeptide (TPR) repeat protein